MLYKTFYKTGETSKLRDDIQPMTKKEAHSLLKAFSGGYEPCCGFFVAPIN